MTDRFNPARDTLFLKSYSELDPATTITVDDGIVVYQAEAPRRASMETVFGAFASAAEFDDFTATVLDAISGAVYQTGTQTITGQKTFTLPIVTATPTASDHATTKAYVDAEDANAVKLSGAQTISGVKTFSDVPKTTATPSANDDLVPKSYVDAEDANAVKLTGAQTIAGSKTFTGNATFSGTITVPNATSAAHAVSKQQLDAVALFRVPVGTIVPYAGTTAPTGWLLCQGQEISRTAYADLFAVMGTAFGDGNGSTTFNLPDMRNRVPAGAGSDGTRATAINTFTKSVPLAQHNHSIGLTSDVASNNHTHSFSATTSTPSANHTHLPNGSYNALFAQANPTTAGAFTLSSTSGTLHGLTNLTTDSVAHQHTVSGTTAGQSDNHTHTVSGNTANAGTNSPTMDVRQKTLYVNYIICTGV